ncbi:helix-turn-helix domain-containing protein [Rhizobium mongolense]|uniref:helix-turn-helix domain-containing protein n=1 Tax=Rhizobium mongolense TaxID=57676 RepID=UPI003556DEB0
MQLVKIEPPFDRVPRRPDVDYSRDTGRTADPAIPSSLFANLPLTLADASPISRLRRIVWTGNLLIGVFIIGLGTWSALAPLSSAAIASGVVETESNRKTIQHLEGGIVRQIFVRNGNAVAAGQVLIELDDTKSRSERDSLRGQLWDAEARRARLIAEENGTDRIGFPPELTEHMARYHSIRDIVTGQQRIFDARRQVMQSEIAITQQRIKQVVTDILKEHQAGATVSDVCQRYGISQPTFYRWHSLQLKDARCLIPGFDGASLSSESKDALWARFFMEAPRRQRQSVERYNIVKRA